MHMTYTIMFTFTYHVFDLHIQTKEALQTFYLLHIYFFCSYFEYHFDKRRDKQEHLEWKHIIYVKNLLYSITFSEYQTSMCQIFIQKWFSYFRWPSWSPSRPLILVTATSEFINVKFRRAFWYIETFSSNGIPILF